MAVVLVVLAVLAELVVLVALEVLVVLMVLQGGVVETPVVETGRGKFRKSMKIVEKCPYSSGAQIMQFKITS